MGIRSDVAVALKKNVFDNLSAGSRQTLSEWFGEPASVNGQGHVLFYTEFVKWYFSSYEDLVALYAELLDSFDEEEYLIVQACHDYPESTEGDLGGWYDNPWGAYRSVRVEVKWDHDKYDV